MTDSTDAVLIEHHDPGVLVVTFNRPETMNAFSSEMSATFTTALRDADTDDSIRVVVVTGSGRAFCAGADFSKGSARSPHPPRKRSRPIRSTRSIRGSAASRSSPQSTATLSGSA